VTSYLVNELHNLDNSQKSCRSVESILEAVASEKQQNCFICDKCQKSCWSVISMLEAVKSEEKQNCSIWDNSYKNCRSVVNTRSVRKVSDRIFLCEHLMDYNLARLHEPTLNLSAHA